MTLEPLLASPHPIPGHTLLAVAALALGAWQLLAPKGTAGHRIVGWVWVALIACVAVSGLFIHQLRMIGPFSPIHLLSFYALVSVTHGMILVRRGEAMAHGAAMRSLYWYALVVAGAFTFVPGRVMWLVVTGG